MKNELTSVRFMEYGNIIQSFEKLKDFECLVTTIFFEDICNSVKNKGIEIILDSLNKSLRLEKPIFLAISYNNNKNLISTSKHENKDYQEYKYFKESLYELSSINLNFNIVDLDNIFSQHGYKHIYDQRNWYFSHMRVSRDGINLIDSAIGTVINRSLSASKKVLILDCDNTLWGGVIGEDGIDGISLGGDGIGHVFKDFQESAKKLKDSGILLALSSKNTEEDVWYVFDNHKEMILQRDDIVCAKINWMEKSENIRQIAEELGLGLDSFVFWDDNPIEREKVKSFLPAVTVINAPVETYEWPDMLLHLDDFSKVQITDSDVKKSDQYKDREKFNKTKSEVDYNQEDFLKKINLKPSLAKINISSLARASEMTQKTNQFNLRTQRYSVTDMKDRLSSEKYECYICSAVDDFGDHGQIGVCIIKYGIDDNSAFLDTFLLSCRILGRDLELWMLQSILKKLKYAGINSLDVEYIKTDKNALLFDFLARVDASQIESSNNTDTVICMNLLTDLLLVDVEKMYED